MKNVVEVTAAVSDKLIRLRENKKEASRRCRARAKAITKGQLLTPELALRSLQPKALKIENFKMEVGNTALRLNKNGGTAVALVISERTETGVVKTRKSFKDLQAAVKGFTESMKAVIA